jgi:uncharacterized protein (DUF488 family)
MHEHMAQTIYTLGHSRRTAAELIAVLKDAGVRRLIDVRAYPHSARQPWFNGPALRASLEREDIGYEWLGRELGGLRPEHAASRHTHLRTGLRSFADYMETDGFVQGIARLGELATRVASAIMCAEKNPADCHRSLIADYLALHDVHVVHLLEVGQRESHRLHPALRRDGRQLLYDLGAQRDLGLD